MAFDASGGNYLSIFYRVLFADEANDGELYGEIRRYEESGEEEIKKTDVKSGHGVLIQAKDFKLEKWEIKKRRM